MHTYTVNRDKEWVSAVRQETCLSVQGKVKEEEGREGGEGGREGGREGEERGQERGLTRHTCCEP